MRRSSQESQIASRPTCFLGIALEIDNPVKSLGLSLVGEVERTRGVDEAVMDLVGVTVKFALCMLWPADKSDALSRGRENGRCVPSYRA